MSQGSLLRTVAGFVVTAVAYAYGGPMGAAVAGIAFGLAANALFPPKAGQSIRNDPSTQPRISSSGYGSVIPQVIGRARVGTSFIEGNYNKWNPVEVTKKVTQGSGKGKTKANVSQGFDYRWSWSLVIGAAGSEGLDAIREVYNVPGESKLLSNAVGGQGVLDILIMLAIPITYAGERRSADNVYSDMVAALAALGEVKGLWYYNRLFSDSTMSFDDFKNPPSIPAEYLAILQVQTLIDRAIYEGESKVVGESEWCEFGASDYIDLSLGGEDDAGPGGECRVYRGSTAQTRVEGDDYAYTGLNYRGTAFAVMSDFSQGLNVVQTPSFNFEVFKAPEVGTTGIKPRVSDDPNNHRYWSANAAATIYHILKVAGRPDELIDIDSFVRASVVCQEHGIGADICISDVRTVSDLCEYIARSSALIVINIGGVVYCFSRLDYEGMYSRVRVVTSDQYDNLTVVRDTRASVPCRVTASWTDPTRNLQINTTDATDEASASLLDCLNVKTINCETITDFVNASKITQLELSGMTNPNLSATFDGSSDLDELHVGSPFVLCIGESYATQTFVPMIVTGKTLGYSESNVIKFDAVSDSNGTVSFGSDFIVSYTMTAPWDISNSVGTESSAIAGGDSDSIVSTGVKGITNRLVIEPPASLGIPNKLIVVSQRPLNTSDAVEVVINESVSDVKTSYVVGGFLSTPLSGDSGLIMREGFTFTLASISDRERLLREGATIPEGGDIASLISSRSGVAVVGKEFIQVGSFSVLDSGEILARDVVRGAFDSTRMQHDVNTRIYWVGSINDDILYDIDETITSGSVVSIKTNPTYGSITLESGLPLYHQVGDVSPKPYEPYIISQSTQGDDLHVTLRPRWRDRGASISNPDDIIPTLDPLSYVLDLDGYMTSVDHTFDPLTGLASVIIYDFSLASNVKLYQTVSGRLSNPITLK